MKTPIRLILMASIGSGLALAQEPERNNPPGTPPPPPERPRETDRAPRDREQPDRPQLEGERPLGGGERQLGGRERPAAEPDRPRANGERPRVEQERRRDGDAHPLARPTQPGHNPPRTQRDLVTRLPQTPQPYLGIVTRDASPELAAQLKLPEGFGLVVEEVLPDSPAKSAGLQRNDLLIRFEDQSLVNPPQLEALVRRAGKDKDATLTILRGGEEQKVTIRIGEKMLPEHRGYPNLPGRFTAPHTPGSGWKESQPSRPPVRGGASSGGERVETERETRYVRNQARAMRSDNDGRYELLSVEGKRTFIAQRPDGTVAWRGPVETPEQKEAVPADLRKKLEMLEQGIVAEPPTIP